MRWGLGEASQPVAAAPLVSVFGPPALPTFPLGWKTNQMRLIPFSEMKTANLIVDATYQSDRSQVKGSLGAEPLSKLLQVGNLGGFRPKSGRSGNMAVILTSTQSEAEWPDELDIYAGTYRYYGDNRSPGLEMHQTKQKGNQILRDAFELAQGTREERQKCPVFFIFETGAEARDFIFRGLAVPGSQHLAAGEDLVAVWRSTGQERFQNYRATFSVLDEATIDGSWIRESFAAGGFLLNDSRAPKSLVTWMDTGKINPLRAERSQVRSVFEQLPESNSHKLVLQEVRRRCESDPWLFEQVAAAIWELNCPSPVEYEVTRRHRDGGRDALGWMNLGPSSDAIKIPFALEAKHYSESNTLGVKETSRLISRIKHREFGVLVTTSAVSAQAYREIRCQRSLKTGPETLFEK